MRGSAASRGKAGSEPASGKHRADPFGLDHLACRAHRTRDFLQQFVKFVELALLLAFEGRLVSAGAGEFLAFAAAPRIKTFEGLVHRAIHRHLRHERPAAMRAVEYDPGLKMAVRNLEVLPAVLADERDL